LLGGGKPRAIVREGALDISLEAKSCLAVFGPFRHLGHALNGSCIQKLDGGSISTSTISPRITSVVVVAAALVVGVVHAAAIHAIDATVQGR